MRFLLVSILSLSSFSALAAEHLQISANTEVWAIPSSTKSCVAWKTGQEENDVPGKHLNLGNLSLTWADTARTLHITSVRVSLKDSLLPGGTHECLIQGSELQALGAAKWTEIPAATALHPQDVETDCRLVCGGIQFQPDISATVNGKIEVTGQARNAQGQEETVTAGLPITADNLEF